MREKLTTLLALGLLLGAPALVKADWEQGVAAFKAGNYAEAARQFQEVTEQHKDWPDGYSMLGQALSKLNRKQDALNASVRHTTSSPGTCSFSCSWPTPMCRTAASGTPPAS